VPLQIVCEIWKARPMNVALDRLVMKNRRIRFDEVRTEGKLLASLLRGCQMLSELTAFPDLGSGLRGMSETNR
jgi:hypothetical protein